MDNNIDEQVRIVQELNDEIVLIAEECLDYIKKLESLNKDKLSNLEKYLVNMFSLEDLSKSYFISYINNLNAYKVTEAEIILNTFEVSKKIPTDVILNLKSDLVLLKNIYTTITTEVSKNE